MEYKIHVDVTTTAGQEKGLSPKPPRRSVTIDVSASGRGARGMSESLTAAAAAVADTIAARLTTMDPPPPPPPYVWDKKSQDEARMAETRVMAIVPKEPRPAERPS